MQALVCERCGGTFPVDVIVDGRRVNLRGRKFIDGKMRSLYRRRFCLECSPFGIHNTSRRPPGNLRGDELVEHRRKRRNAKTYRYLKKRRKQIKLQLIALRGGRCEACGYSGPPAALQFHHRDPTQKDFTISRFAGPWPLLGAEAEKCDLLCANCHRMHHAQGEATLDSDAVVEFRRRSKIRAVKYMGGECFGCGRIGPAALFDFHHLDPTAKEFGIAQSGIPRPWERILAELAKCVMLCANCHSEVHAGGRELGAGRIGLAEASGRCVA